MRSPEVGRPKVMHPYAVFWGPLESDLTFLLRPMFGARAVYLHGRIVLCFVAREEPWRGVLVATERAHHAALLAELPALTAHPILPKWLYLAEAAARFESTVEHLVRLVRRRDPRIGVVPKTKAPTKSKRPRIKRGIRP